jgi:RNA polymerase sigma factor (sigma-70 family)
MRDDAFERLYSEHAASLLAFLVYKTGDRPAAEDLLVDTFERVLNARRGFDRRQGSEKTWLYSIALNLVRDRARRRAAEHRAYERVEATAGAGGARAPEEVLSERDELSRALDTLSDEEREAVALRFGADMTVVEIARVLGEKETTVEGRVYRALRKLREALPERP